MDPAQPELFWRQGTLVEELQRPAYTSGHQTVLPAPIGSPRSLAVPQPSPPPPPSNRQQASPPYRVPWRQAGPTEAERKIAAARKAKSIDGTPPQITDVELAAHCDGAAALYMAIDGKVYDITNYVNKHPGGVLMMTRNAGQDVTAVFNRVGHSNRAREFLADMYVGDLVRTESGASCASSAARPAPAASSNAVVSTARSLAPPP